MLDRTPAPEIIHELLGEIRWSLEMAIALSPIGRRIGARVPHIQDMRRFGAALILAFEPPRKRAARAAR